MHTIYKTINGKLTAVAQGETRRTLAPMIMKDSFSGISPLSDPSVVFNSRKDMEEYCKRTGKEFLGDYKDEDFLPPSPDVIAARKQEETFEMTREITEFYEQNSDVPNNIRRLYNHLGLDYDE